MFRSKLMVSVLSAASVLSSQAVLAPSAWASVVDFRTPVQAKLGEKIIHMSVCNHTSEKVTLKMGDTQITVQPGATVKLNVAEGTKIVNVDATKTHEAGAVLVEVSKSLSGATLGIS